MLQTLASDHPEYVPSPREDFERDSAQDAAVDRMSTALEMAKRALAELKGAEAELDRSGTTMRDAGGKWFTLSEHTEFFGAGLDAASEAIGNGRLGYE